MTHKEIGGKKAARKNRSMHRNNCIMFHISKRYTAIDCVMTTVCILYLNYDTARW